MSLAKLSIKKPVFLTCVIILMLAVGGMSLFRLPVDLFPNINFPVVTVTTIYAGAGPNEIETNVSKILESELSSISGIKTIRSISREGVSQVVIEFTLETDIKYAEQQVKDRVATAKRKLPTDIKEPTIRRISPSDQPIATITLKADLPMAKLFDLAEEEIRPKLEQVPQIGLVTVVGGRKREIHVDLDRRKLKEYELPASVVTQRIEASGQNIPIGKIDQGEKEISLRTVGEFKSLTDLKNVVINFIGNDVAVNLSNIGTVHDGLVDETSKTYHNGESTLVLMVFKQSDSNTIAVTKGVEKQMTKLQEILDKSEGSPKLKIVRKVADQIEANVFDVEESIFIGIGLTILVVFLFLGSGRSTLITGLALPNSLMGAFILMSWAGFSINVMSLLALSLSVGLLVDDAIVVRENIFRHRGMGKSAMQAAIDGTQEVTLAVIATTLTVIAVFGPIGFLSGIVGQFFKEFGLSICFAMVISLFDALTIAPMMSAYFGGSHHEVRTGIYKWTVGVILDAFESFQKLLERGYERVLKFTMRHPFVILVSAFLFFVASIYCAKWVPKTFLSPQDNGEFAVALDLPPGTNLEKMDEVARQVDQAIRSHAEVETTLLTVGNREGASNVADFYIHLVPSKKRTINTSAVKDILRADLKAFAFANPVVKDIDAIGGGWRPFNVNIVGSDLTEVAKVAQDLFAKIKDNPALKDVDISHRPGKPEIQFVIDRNAAEKVGVSPNAAGFELRNLVEGTTPAVFRENGREYDIRVRLRPDQRDLKQGYYDTYVPNINFRTVKLSNVATINETTGPATINRQDRGRYVQVSADIAPKGPGMNQVMVDIKNLIDSGEVKLGPGMRYQFVGQAESFVEMIKNMTIAITLSIVFIYLVLASLYESFVTPFTIMLVLPLAITGAIFALLIMGASFDLNSMIGCILLLGIATKNSILLVDYATQKVGEGMDRNLAMIEAGKTRLRPILMTSVALIAGMLPIAYGLNEASKQRTSMGIAIIGGLITSTLLSLLVVPASYAYVERFRVWISGKMARIFVSH
jgi:hydrophobic/amphiphilic exporter-1 (mainly G- bacteria), HAE1 family